MEENEIHFEGKIALKVIVEKGGRVLLVQDPREERNIWELPGGRMNLNEEPNDAIMREFREEMGVEISVGEVVFMQQFLQGNEGKHAFVVVFKASLTDESKPFSLANDEVSQVGWFLPEEARQLTLFPEYANALEKYFTDQAI